MLRSGLLKAGSAGGFCSCETSVGYPVSTHLRKRMPDSPSGAACDASASLKIDSIALSTLCTGCSVPFASRFCRKAPRPVLFEPGGSSGADTSNDAADDDADDDAAACSADDEDPVVDSPFGMPPPHTRAPPIGSTD
eukprot:4326789-Pleurochrysis_carterae.AAC.4